MGIPGCREQNSHLDASRWNVLFTLWNIIYNMNMKTFEIMSETADGDLDAVVSTEATSAEEARLLTTNFCDMLDIEVHSIREV